MGMVIIDYSNLNKNVSFEKCKPVHSSIAEDNIQSRLLDECWRIAFPRYGFNCGAKYLPLSTVKSGNDIVSNYYFQNALKAQVNPSYFEKYEGDQFIGDDLRVYPLHRTSTIKAKSGILIPRYLLIQKSNIPSLGPLNQFRAVFELKDGEFKGIINLKDEEAKCVSIWDLSSSSSETIYSPSSILHMERVLDKYWPKACFGYWFKYKTIWLFIEFALKDWSANWGGRILNFPIVEQNGSLFWPVRIPETHIKSKYSL
ncbi:putative secreted effector protein [Blumeria graminis f. sp. tritici 96224]|nr:putative secreted effector protein [Blumeria graminis f. sp. tritici 96224]